MANNKNGFFAVNPQTNEKRFLRPIAYQNYPEELLPIELQDANKLGGLRRINGKLTREPLN